MDLSRTREIFERPGPFATVYLEAVQAGENSAKQVELRWRDLQNQLQQQGADDKTIAALDDELGDDRAGSLTEVGRVLVASADGVLFDDEVEAVGAAGDVAIWSPLPELGRYYRSQSSSVRTLLAIVDQTGGDLYELVAAYETGARELDEQHISGSAVENVHKAREGGNAHKQRQRRHEKATYQNAEEVVAGLRSAASSFRPQVLALAGEVQGRQAVRSQLPTELSEITQELDAGSRAAGASESALEDELLRVAGTIATGEEGRVREQLLEGKAHANAVEGLEPVLEAARTGAVDTLVLVDGQEIPGELYVGSSPEQISTDPKNLAQLSDTEPVARPAEQVLLRAVGALGGSVSVLGGGTSLQDGVGALLRFPTGS
ncbi:baeRF2 domain-containing protein [Actinomycetospora sp. C-140]